MKRIFLILLRKEMENGMNFKVEKKNQRVKLVEVCPLDTPYVIMLDPCDCCNFKCAFCPTNISHKYKELRFKYMSMEQFEKIVSDLKEFPNKVKVVELYGFGEPLLNENIAAMIKLLKEAEVTEQVRIATNGSLLTHELSEKLVEAGLDYMKISIEALDNAGYVSIANMRVDVARLKSEISYLYDISRGKMEIGIKIISESLKNEKDAEKFYEMYTPISDYTFIEDIKNIWSGFEEMQLEADEKRDYYSQNVQGYKICSYPLTHMVIHTNGDVGACCFDWTHETSYGNVFEESLYSIWKSDKAKRFRKLHLKRKQQEIPFCNECKMKGFDNIDDDAEKILNKLDENIKN